MRGFGRVRRRCTAGSGECQSVACAQRQAAASPFEFSYAHLDSSELGGFADVSAERSKPIETSADGSSLSSGRRQVRSGLEQQPAAGAEGSSSGRNNTPCMERAQSSNSSTPLSAVHRSKLHSSETAMSARSACKSRQAKARSECKPVLSVSTTPY